MIIAPKHLREEVRKFTADGLVLGDDLRKLALAHNGSLHEATVLYATRILEVTARKAVRLVGLRPAHDVYTNLEVLRQFGILGDADAAWPHALRRIGNDSRHVLGPIVELDVELAVVFLGRWIEWFFCRHPKGNCLPSLIAGDAQFLHHRNDNLKQWLDILDQRDAEKTRELALEFIKHKTTADLGPWFVAALAERLIGQGDLELTGKLLDHFEHWPRHEPRITQLRLLRLSRLGELDDGRAMALAVELKGGNPDGESLGIVAGFYKRLVLERRPDRKFSQHDIKQLKESARLYKLGWKNSRRMNTYLGINAAATALWLGEGDEARKLAERIRDLIQVRLKTIDANVGALGLWEQLTLAEALLLSGDMTGAIGEYRAAKARFPDSVGSIEKAIWQARIHSDCLDVQFPDTLD